MSSIMPEYKGEVLGFKAAPSPAPHIPKNNWNKKRPPYGRRGGQNTRLKISQRCAFVVFYFTLKILGPMCTPYRDCPINFEPECGAQHNAI